MKIVARNRRAHFDYDISSTIVAGLVLLGSEVKSAKAGHISLKGSFISVHNDELFLVNAHINPYPYAQNNHEPTRSRKLLVHKKELKQTIALLSQDGFSAVPLSVGIERGLVKLEYGIGRGRKRHDKREVIKKRESNREVDRAVKQITRN